MIEDGRRDLDLASLPHLLPPRRNPHGTAWRQRSQDLEEPFLVERKRPGLRHDLAAGPCEPRRMRQIELDRRLVPDGLDVVPPRASIRNERDPAPVEVAAARNAAVSNEIRVSARLGPERR